MKKKTENNFVKKQTKIQNAKNGRDVFSFTYF